MDKQFGMFLYLAAGKGKTKFSNSSLWGEVRDESIPFPFFSIMSAVKHYANFLRNRDYFSLESLQLSYLTLFVYCNRCIIN